MMKKVDPFPEPLPGPDQPPAPDLAMWLGMTGCGGIPLRHVGFFTAS